MIPTNLFRLYVGNEGAMIDYKVLLSSPILQLAAANEKEQQTISKGVPLLYPLKGFKEHNVH